MKKRLFIALNLPEKVKKQIFETYSQHIPQEGYKVVPQANLHLTLAFLGYLEEKKEESLKKKLAEIKLPAFDLKLTDLGQFNNRVIWVGATEGEESAKQLFQTIKEKIGLEEDRFHCHFTIARVKHPNKKEVAELMSKLKQKEFTARITIKSFELMESKLKRPAPEYLTVKSFSLT
jgi:2'-5' RNA ligase